MIVASAGRFVDLQVSNLSMPLESQYRQEGLTNNKLSLSPPGRESTIVDQLSSKTILKLIQYTMMKRVDKI